MSTTVQLFGDLEGKIAEVDKLASELTAAELNVQNINAAHTKAVNEMNDIQSQLQEKIGALVNPRVRVSK